MTDINKPSNSENMGGIQCFWFIPVSWVSAIGNKTNGIIQSVTLLTGKSWLRCYCTLDTIMFSQVKKISSAGEYFDTKLSGWTPKDSSDLLAQMSEMDEHKFLCIYKDNNGNYKLIGTIAEPLNFVDSLEIPETVAGSNGRAITFTRELRNRSNFMANPF